MQQDRTDPSSTNGPCTPEFQKELWALCTCWPVWLRTKRSAKWTTLEILELICANAGGACSVRNSVDWLLISCNTQDRPRAQHSLVQLVQLARALTRKASEIMASPWFTLIAETFVTSHQTLPWLLQTCRLSLSFTTELTCHMMSVPSFMSISLRTLSKHPKKVLSIENLSALPPQQRMNVQ